MCLAAVLIPEISKENNKHISGKWTRRKFKGLQHRLCNTSSCISAVTLAFWIAFGVRCSLGNANNPPSMGGQLNPGRLLTTSWTFFTLWTSTVLICSISCRRHQLVENGKFFIKNSYSATCSWSSSAKQEYSSEVQPVYRAGTRGLLALEGPSSDSGQSDLKLVNKNLWRTACGCISWQQDPDLPARHIQHGDHT